MSWSNEERSGQMAAGWSRPSMGRRRRRIDRGDAEAPRWQFRFGALDMLLAGATAVAVLVDESPLFCSTLSQTSGANVATGAGIALAAGFLGLIPLVGVRLLAPRSMVPIRLVMLAEAAALSVAVGFVARDSATYRQTLSCGFMFDDTTTRSTGHVYYACVLWGVSIALLLSQAFRGWSGRRRDGGLIGAVAAAISVCVAVAVFPARGGAGANGSRATRPPTGVLVCRAFDAPEAFGGPQCNTDVDVGRAPITPPEGLMCSTDLRGVRGKMIGIRVLYGRALIKHANLRSSDAETTPWAYFDVNDVQSGTGQTVPTVRLPVGSYRCRFLVNQRLVRERTVRIRRRAT